MRAATTARGDRLGCSVAQVWRWFVRVDRRVIVGLCRLGVSSRVSWWISFAGKALLIAILFVLAFWAALLLIFCIGVVWSTSRIGWAEEPEPEWRDGLSGFGLYRGDIRIDIGDPYEDV